MPKSIFHKNVLASNKIVYQTIRSFGDIIHTGKIIIDEVVMDHSNILENMVEFDDKTRPRKKEDKEDNYFR